MKKKSMVLEALHAKLAQEELDDSAIDGVSEAVDDSDIGTDTEDKQKEADDVEGADNAGDTEAKEEGGEAAGTGDDSGAADADEVKVDEDANRSDDSGAADASGEGEGAEEKKEPSPDAEVTELPDELDEQPNTEESEKDDADDEDEVEEEEESEEEIAEKADAVADLADAKQSLEEIAEQIEATLQDGGLTPEAAVVAQGAVDDVLESVDITPIGLPSQESFGTFEGRRANTRLVLESVAVGISKIAMKIYQFIREMIAAIAAHFKDNDRKLRATGEKADQAIAKVDADPANAKNTKHVGIEFNGSLASAFRLEEGAFRGQLEKADFAAISSELVAVGNALNDAAATAIHSLDGDGQFDINKLCQNKVMNYHLKGRENNLAFGWHPELKMVHNRNDAMRRFHVSAKGAVEAKDIMKVSKTISDNGSEFVGTSGPRLDTINVIVTRLEAKAKSGASSPTQEQTSGLHVVKAVVLEIGTLQKMFVALSNATLDVGVELYMEMTKH